MKVDPSGLNHRLKKHYKPGLQKMMFFSSKINYEIRTDARGVAKGGDGLARAPRNLADQLTLLKPRGGGQIMPVTLLPAPLDAKCYLHLWVPLLPPISWHLIIRYMYNVGSMMGTF